MGGSGVASGKCTVNSAAHNIEPCFSGQGSWITKVKAESVSSSEMCDHVWNVHQANHKQGR
jgi:hypothetical protein